MAVALLTTLSPEVWYDAACACYHTLHSQQGVNVDRIQITNGLLLCCFKVVQANLQQGAYRKQLGRNSECQAVWTDRLRQL